MVFGSLTTIFGLASTGRRGHLESQNELSKLESSPTLIDDGDSDTSYTGDGRIDHFGLFHVHKISGSPDHLFVRQQKGCCQRAEWTVIQTFGYLIFSLLSRDCT
jgi:hypothetical protein